MFLEEVLGQDAPEASPRLKVPTDLNVYNEEHLPLRQAAADAWPSPYDTMASRGRFDLILALADPRTQPAPFFMAAAQAGQIDLISRYLAMEKTCSLDNLGYLYPTALAPVVAQAIQEEGMQGLVDPAFILSVIKCESLFQPTASSSADAQGMMQLLKGTFTPLMGRGADIRDPLTNIHAGLKYFKRIIKVVGLEHVPAPVRYAYLLIGYQAGDGRAKAWYREFEPVLQQGTQPKAILQRIESVPIYSTRHYLLRVLGDDAVYSRLLGS
jgi:soluble lytic murein transglycosylase